MTDPIIVRAVVVFRSHAPTTAPIGRGRRGVVALGADRKDLGQLARNSNDGAAAGRPIPVRLRSTGPGPDPPPVGRAANFRVLAGAGDSWLLVADVELDPEHLGAIPEDARATIERGRWDDRRLQHVAEVVLVDPAGRGFGPEAGVLPLRLAEAG